MNEGEHLRHVRGAVLLPSHGSGSALQPLTLICLLFTAHLRFVKVFFLSSAFLSILRQKTEEKHLLVRITRELKETRTFRIHRTRDCHIF